MNFILFVLGSFGNKEKFALAQRATWGKIILAVMFTITVVSIVQGALLYTRASHIFSDSLPAIIAQWGDGMELVFKEGVLQTVPTSTISTFTVGQNKNIFSITVNPTISRAQVTATGVQNATLARDGFVLQSRGIMENTEYPKYDLTVTKSGVMRFLNEFESLGVGLLVFVVLFLCVVHSIAALVTWILFLFIVRVYTRFFPPLITFSEAGKIGLYLIVPFSITQVCTFFVFGTQIFFISIIVTVLCLHYGFKKHQ